MSDSQHIEIQTSTGNVIQTNNLINNNTNVNNIISSVANNTSSLNTSNIQNSANAQNNNNNGKPRGKMTAYAFFVHTCRQELKNSRPNQNVVFGEFSKKCAAKWKELEPHNKKPFEEMAARDKQRWEQEVEQLNRQKQQQQAQWLGWIFFMQICNFILHIYFIVHISSHVFSDIYKNCK